MENDRHLREKLFWNKYLTSLKASQIKPQYYPWYVRHCETFIRTYKDKRLRQHTSESLAEYLESVCSISSKPSWQRRQIIDAIQMLFLITDSALNESFDWEYRKMSSKTLETDHASLARENYPLKSLEKPAVKAVVEAGKPLINAKITAVCAAIRSSHYSIRTEKTYAHWIQNFLVFHADKIEVGLNDTAVISYLNYLSLEKQVAPATQALALNAIAFYFKTQLQTDLSDISQFVKAKHREKFPTALTGQQVALLLAELKGVQWLLASLMYGAGLRVMEALRLRVQDIDFGQQFIVVRQGKGNKERRVPLPVKLAMTWSNRFDHVTDIRTIQELLGHSDIATTMIYTHVANFADGKTSSPLYF